jgi:hypothetical protein
MIMRLPWIKVYFLPVCLLLAACTSSTCPEGMVGYLSPPYPPEDIEFQTTPQQIEIGRQQVMVDEVISGDLCNDTWSGTVYVTCDLRIPAWEEESLFLQDCDLEIEEGTIVYVEAHGDQPYYEGCSCHE